MPNNLKTSLWSLVLAATAIGAVPGTHTQASPPELAFAGTPFVAAVKPDATAARADAGSLKSFGFLEFDWDPNAPGGVPGFDSRPSRELRVAEASARN